MASMRGSAVSEALRQVLAAINEADAQTMVGRRPKPEISVEVEMEGEDNGEEGNGGNGEMEGGGEGVPEHSEAEWHLIEALEELNDPNEDRREGENGEEEGPPMQRPRMKRPGY